jgi:hypothetical protein
MSLLTAPMPALYPVTEEVDVTGLRYVDSAVRLHGWSLPTPHCIHDVVLSQSCDACDAELAE